MRTQLSLADAGRPAPVAVTGPDELAVGAKCGPWVVEHELGRGGMGAVYAVHHEEIGKRAALKIVHGHLLGTTFNTSRMVLEAKVVNQVGHPGIVDIFETGQLPDGRPYLVMERLEGQSLAARCDQGKLPPRVAIAILEQIADALIAAHDAGIVHRDLKLDNVFLLENADDATTPKAKVLDWGIAKVINTDVCHTIEGQLVGTPQYLAPEQARGKAVSPKTDVYSLGVMAYELFTDVLPFEAETAAETMTMHLRATPQSPRELEPQLLPVLESLILQMLAKDPAARPEMRDVLGTLRAAGSELAGLDPHAAPLAGSPGSATSVLNAARLYTPSAIRTTLAGVQSAPILVTSARALQIRPVVVPTTRQQRVSARVAPWKLALGGAAVAMTVALVWFAQGGDVVAQASTAEAALGQVIVQAPPEQTFAVALPPTTNVDPTMPAATAPSSSPRHRAAAPDLASTPVTPVDEPIVVMPAARPRPRAHAAIATTARTATVPSSTRRAPRHAAPLDPNATLDPYR